MSSFSLTSWPMRCMGWPHSGLGQAVSAGSWWCSTRSRCSGRAWRLGLARGTEARLGVSGRPALSAANCACKPASSSTTVSSNRRRCSALIASVLAANFQRL
jgi:hypothetical protein